MIRQGSTIGIIESRTKEIRGKGYGRVEHGSGFRENAGRHVS